MLSFRECTERTRLILPREYQTDIVIRQRMNSAFQSDTSIKTVTAQPCQAGLAINRDISIGLRMYKTYMYSTKLIAHREWMSRA